MVKIDLDGEFDIPKPIYDFALSSFNVHPANLSCYVGLVSIPLSTLHIMMIIKCSCNFTF
jgi:hypothetical protein